MNSDHCGLPIARHQHERQVLLTAQVLTTHRQCCFMRRCSLHTIEDRTLMLHGMFKTVAACFINRDRSGVNVTVKLKATAHLLTRRATTEMMIRPQRVCTSLMFRLRGYCIIEAAAQAC